MIERSRGFFIGVLVCFACLARPVTAAGADVDVPKLMQFAGEMARKGNWREARYRWEQVLPERPDDAHVLNNLAVAHEALGDPTGARSLYEKAVRASAGDAVASENLASLARFEARTGDGNAPARASAEENPEIHEKKGAKTLRVRVSVPVPARIDLTGVKKLLVISFLAPDCELLDLNREAVRYLRGIPQHTSLEVQDVTPPRFRNRPRRSGRQHRF
jgi:hypothetical protein